MKNVFALILFISCVYTPLVSQAQAPVEKSKVPFRFIYVAHDDEVLDEPGALVNALKQRKENIDYSDQFPCIFYLSNGMRIESNDTLAAKPIIIKLNLPDENADDFEDVFLKELNKVAHEVDTDADIDNILKLIDENDIFDGNNNIAYESITFDFYVNQKFWNDRCNESLIARLYFILDAYRYDKGRIKFNVHYIKSEKPEFALKADNVFGSWNVNGVNKQIQILK